MKTGSAFGQKGFTLVELMMVTILLPILFLAIFSSLSMANVVFQTNNASAQLNQSAMQVLRYIGREIEQTSPNASPGHLSISSDANSNSIVRFQIPVDWDNDGDVVTDNLDPVVEWGIYNEANQKQNGRLNGWARYSVVNNQLMRDVLDASLNPVSGLSRVVANNVQSFTAVQSQKTLILTLTLQNTDQVGQAGTQRTFQSSFSSTTLLRNAVN